MLSALVQQPTSEPSGDGRRAGDSCLSQMALGGEAGEEEEVEGEVEGGSGGHPGSRGCS